MTTRTQWVRVKKNNPCPICGNTNWCLISADGKSAICPRVESPKTAGQAGWLHNLENNIALPVQPVKTEKPSFKAPPSIINETYNRLLSELRLSDRHKENLVKRGLTENQIAYFNFRSMPRLDDRYRVIQRLLDNKTQLKGVPGFWMDTFDKYHLSGPEGIAIPVKDLECRIFGLQIRCDVVIDKNKYKWLSSLERPNGCSSGTSVHVARPEQFESDEVWVTEGPLKADIACLKLKRIVLAIPGVSCWAEAVPILCRLKIKKVVLALDMDKLTNKYVETYLAFLINRLMELNFTVYEANWNDKYKGLDDILATGEMR